MEKSLYVILNKTCNLSCSYCFQRKASIHTTKSPTKKEIDIALKYIKGLDGLASVTIMGGEACLERDFFVALLRVLEEKKITANLITNGTVYLPELAKYKSTLKHIQVSIDTPLDVHDKNRCYKDGTGSFATCVRTAEKYFADGFEIDLHGVIPLDNYKSAIDGMCEILKRFPVEINYGLEIEHGVNDSGKLRYAVAKYYYHVIGKMKPADRIRLYGMRSGANGNGLTVCTAGTQMMTLDMTTGELYSCHETIGLPDTQYHMGHIKATPTVEEIAVYNNMMLHDPAKYYIRGVPHFVSEIFKYLLPLPVCWYNISKQDADQYAIPKADLYIAWKNYHELGRQFRAAKQMRPNVFIPPLDDVETSKIDTKQRAKVGRAILEKANGILRDHKPCAGCTDFCCKDCTYLGENGCTTACLVCRLFLCDTAWNKLPVSVRKKLRRLTNQALLLGYRCREKNEELV